MRLLTNEVYHLYNRGNDRQLLFYHYHNYRHFLQLMKYHLVPHCDLLAYCLMPNHFHFLISPNKATNEPYRTLNRQDHKRPLVQMTKFSRGLQMLLSRYAKTINHQYNRSGSLFTQNTRIKQTSSELFTKDYALYCFIYIHNNPKTAGLVESPAHWEFSSYNDYLRNDPQSICNLALGHKEFCLNQNEIFEHANRVVPQPFLGAIR